MNYKEEAIQLFNKMKVNTECKCNSWDDDNAKANAIVAIDAILEAVSVNKVLYLTDMTYQIFTDWTKVKEELIKLKINTL